MTTHPIKLIQYTPSPESLVDAKHDTVHKPHPGKSRAGRSIKYCRNGTESSGVS